MPRRKRPDPFSEGSLKVIYERFFQKLIEMHCPKDKTYKEFLEDIWGVDYVHIDFWKVKKAFKMPGLLQISGNVKIQGSGWRQTRRGNLILTRTDDRDPNRIHLDFFSGRGNGEWLFSLTAQEWAQVQLQLDKVVK